MLKVLFINSEYNGVAYWRMWEPARFLNKRDDVRVTYWTSEKEMFKKASEWESLARSHDIIVTGRVSEPESLATILTIREISQKPIITEMDDNWWDVDPNSPAYDYWRPGSQAYQVAGAQCSKSDFFQFSTLPLKRQMCTKFKKWDKAYIAPNLIDFDAWQKCRKKYKKAYGGDKIKIGWGGSATHYSDFQIIVPALKEILNKYKNVELVVRGLKADFFVQKEDKWEYDNLRKRMAHRKKSPLPLDQVKYLDGSHFNKWASAVSKMGLDICIVPLVQSKFNDAKSNCRYLEFSALGIPGVYSNVYPYAHTVDHGNDGYCAETVEEWVEHLSNLIESESLRKEIGAAAKEKCFQEYSLQENIYKWADMYKDMNERIGECHFQPYYRPEDGQGKRKLCHTQHQGLPVTS